MYLYLKTKVKRQDPTTMAPWPHDMSCLFVLSGHTEVNQHYVQDSLILFIPILSFWHLKESHKISMQFRYFGVYIS